MSKVEENSFSSDTQVDKEDKKVFGSQEKPERPDAFDVLNPGDQVDPEATTIEEKSRQIAVDAPDITGDHIKVPTYFIVEEPDGTQKALHHIKDAEEISDVIRQARTDENGNRIWR
jgi:hypothetical protein